MLDIKKDMSFSVVAKQIWFPPHRITVDIDVKRKRSFCPDSILDLNDKKPKLSKRVSFQEPLSPYTFNKPGVIKFITGSKYLGKWSKLGMCGKGMYKFPHGVIYDGQFNSNGEFHGSGIIIYPNGQRIEGFWKNGKLSSGTVSNNRCLFREDYCKFPDRRFQIELESELQPAGQENLTNGPLANEIPDECYDTGQGFYDPKKHIIRSYQDTNKLLTLEESSYWLDDTNLKSYCALIHLTPSEENAFKLMKVWHAGADTFAKTIPTNNLEQWFKTYCRKAWDAPVGYMPDLYEERTPGYKNDLAKKDSQEDLNECDPWQMRSTESSTVLTNFQSFFEIRQTSSTSSWMLGYDSDGKRSQTSMKSNMTFRFTVTAKDLDDLIYDQIQLFSNMPERLQRLRSMKGQEETSNFRKFVLPKLK